MTNDKNLRLIALAELDAVAKSRPAGYREEVLSAAEWVSDTLCALTPEKYAALRKKYGSDKTPDPAVWGPALWEKIHTATPPDNGRREWMVWLLVNVPCGHCRHHTTEYIGANPVDYDNWFAWTVGLHNSVNRKLAKAEMTLEDARQRWPKIT